METEKFKYCNHHHELTDRHEVVDFGDGEFVANKEAIPLLKALNEAGIKTRTHHYTGKGISFLGILIEGLSIEIREVHENGSSRSKYNGKTELLISWDK